jgi:tetratricopeptide (TPR) repeat protein
MYRAAVSAYYGKLASSRDFARRAVDSATRSDAKDRAAWAQVVEGIREQFVGNPGLAVRQARGALELSKSRDILAVASMIFALAGETADANRLRAEISKKYPEDTLAQVQLLPLIEASLLMHENKPTQAIDTLVPAIPFEAGFVQPGFRLTPAYLRGLVFLQNKQGPEAAAEFKKIVGHESQAGTSIVAPLASLGLARSYALMGDTAKARTAYQDFFSLWKDADPDVPILIQAKSEYAKLPQ